MISVERLKQQIKENRWSFRKVDLDQNGDPEYMMVYDKVTKYILPMHGWYPYITKIEKIYNLKLEAKYEEYKTKAFGLYEDFKFHGTDNKGVTGISKQGFRLGSGGMYGAGIYFATDSSKSSRSIYTKGSNKLLLCKVFLGKAKTLSCAQEGLTGEQLRSEGFDSVYAPRGTQESGGVINDEFVVFDPRQAIVQYVIHYSTEAGLPSAKMGQLIQANPGQAFRKIRMTPDRTVNLKDPMEAAYRFAEGHFYRMSVKYKNVCSNTISAITIVVNGRLAANFAKTQKAFDKEKKGRLTFYYFLCLR